MITCKQTTYKQTAAVDLERGEVIGISAKQLRLELYFHLWVLQTKGEECGK
jgi:hypothetical protein